MRRIIGECLTGTRSQTEFERQPVPVILRAVQVLMALEQRLKTDSPVTDEDISACCAMAVEDIDHPGKNATLLEAMLTKSLDQVKPKGPQPIVPALDNWPGREIAGSHDPQGSTRECHAQRERVFFCED
jgi:hypothetical protein